MESQIVCASLYLLLLFAVKLRFRYTGSPVILKMGRRNRKSGIKKRQKLVIEFDERKRAYVKGLTHSAPDQKLLLGSLYTLTVQCYHGSRVCSLVYRVGLKAAGHRRTNAGRRRTAAGHRRTPQDDRRTAAGRRRTPQNAAERPPDTAGRCYIFRTCTFKATNRKYTSFRVVSL